MKFVKCRDCGKKRELYAKGLCRACYRKLHPGEPKLSLCTECMRLGDFTLKQIHALGLCRKHYDAQRYALRQSPGTGSPS